MINLLKLKVILLYQSVSAFSFPMSFHREQIICVRITSQHIVLQTVQGKKIIKFGLIYYAFCASSNNTSIRGLLLLNNEDWEYLIMWYFMILTVLLQALHCTGLLPHSEIIVVFYTFSCIVSLSTKLNENSTG